MFLRKKARNGIEEKTKTVYQGKVYLFLRCLFIVVFTLTLTAILTACGHSIDIMMLLTIALIIAVAYCCYRFDIPKFGLVIFIVSTIITLIVALILNTPIDSDFVVQYNAAQLFTNGDYSFGESEYFQNYPFQTSLVIIEGMLLKIWNNPLILRFMNCLLNSGINVLIYYMASEFFNKKAAQCMSICYLIFLFPTTFVSVLSNQTYSAFFIYLGLYIIISKRFDNIKWYLKYTLSGCFVAVGNAIRPEGLIAIISVTAYFVFALFKGKKKADIFSSLKKVTLFLATYFILSSLLSNAVILAGINSGGLENRASYWKFVVGTNYDSSGAYSQQDYYLIGELAEKDGITRDEASKQIIKERLSVSPFRLLELGYKKIGVFWWDSANCYLMFQLAHMQSTYPVIYSTATHFTQVMFFSIFILLCIGSLLSFKKYKDNLKFFIMPFIIFTVFLIYLVIEVQIRYSFIVLPAVFVLAAGGIEKCVDFVKRCKQALYPEKTIKDDIAGLNGKDS